MPHWLVCVGVQEDVVAEARIMATFHHPNLLPLLASFTDKDELWMIEPYVSHGSVLNIMKYHPLYKKGLPEDDIKVIMFEMLKGLEYLHRNNMIHRDVKAGNILVDEVRTSILIPTRSCPSHLVTSRIFMPHSEITPRWPPLDSVCLISSTPHILHGDTCRVAKRVDSMLPRGHPIQGEQKCSATHWSDCRIKSLYTRPCTGRKNSHAQLQTDFSLVVDLTPSTVHSPQMIFCMDG
jgi:serine/threonine protein kinase